MTVKPIFEEIIVKFHAKVVKDAALQKELEGISKSVNIDLGTETYSFLLSDKKVTDFKEGLLPTADIIITSDPQTITDLYTGKMKVMKAWALKKVRIKGKIEDVLKFRKFF
jgi:putative sterol carrier protein